MKNKGNSDRQNELIRSLLLQEASISSMNLGVGLTFIRKYDYLHLGFLYQSLFSLSVGLERLMKIILFFDYCICNNGKTPGHNFFYKEGHDLLELYDKCYHLGERYGMKGGFDCLNKISIIGLKLISEFAQSDRYFYLNQIEKGIFSENKDPHVKWKKEFESSIIREYYNEINTRYQKDKFPYIEPFGFDVSFDDYCVPYVQKYSVKYIHELIRVLARILSEQNDNLPQFAFVYEFFLVFLNSDHQKKSWNPYIRSFLRF